jgi:Ni,Fe-hydrogenase III small subunit
MPEMISDPKQKRPSYRWQSTSFFQLMFRQVTNIFRRRKLPFGLQPPDITAAPGCLFVRHLDCGSCNACEMELAAILNPVYDSERFGITFTAFPRHAHVLAMTGVMTRNLVQAAELTLEAMPEGCIVTVGDCTQGGGIFAGSYAIVPLPESVKRAVIAHVVGCPPAPEDILRGLIKVSRIK